jgi:hypothetical protein
MDLRYFILLSSDSNSISINATFHLKKQLEAVQVYMKNTWQDMCQRLRDVTSSYSIIIINTSFVVEIKVTMYLQKIIVNLKYSCVQEKKVQKKQCILCCGKCELSPTLLRKVEVEHFISRKTHKLNALRFWVRVWCLTLISLF